jgi:hypothetical protein
MAVPEHADPFASSLSALACSSAASLALPSPPRQLTPAEAPSKRACTHARNIAAMVPIADFCNHSFSRSLSHFEVLNGGEGDSRDCVSLVCDCSVKSGQEVFICYGAKTTAQLLCFYGFETGVPLPCDVLHVALVMPPLPTIPKVSRAAAAMSGGDCGSVDERDISAEDVCLAYLSQCSLRISDDTTIACPLISPLLSYSSPSPLPASPPSSSSHFLSQISSEHSTHYHDIVNCQPCVGILTAVADCIRVIIDVSHVSPSDGSLSCKSEGKCSVSVEETFHNGSLALCQDAEGGDWLQVISSDG